MHCRSLRLNVKVWLHFEARCHSAFDLFVWSLLFLSRTEKRRHMASFAFDFCMSRILHRRLHVLSASRVGLFFVCIV